MSKGSLIFYILGCPRKNYWKWS